MGKRDSALAAGFTKTSAHSSATRMLGRERVLDAIRRGAEKQIVAGVAIGAATLAKLAAEAKSEDVRLKAACALLDRGGLPLIRQTETRHLFTDRRTDAELLEHVKHLAGELKVPLPGGLIEGQGEAESVGAAQAEQPPVKVDGATPTHADEIEDHGAQAEHDCSLVDGRSVAGKPAEIEIAVTADAPEAISESKNEPVGD